MNLKNLLLLTGLILNLAIGTNVLAQNPEASTASNPKWYYIQVTGTGVTANRVLTVVDDQVQGQALAMDNISMLNNQLWRLELVPSVGYLIINKSTGKKLTVVYDSANQQRMAIVSDDASTCWRYGSQSTNNSYYIRLANETGLEGTAGEVYLYQSSASQNYVLIMTGTDNSTRVNASFSFVLSEIPVASTDDEIVWMYVKNLKTGKYLTDAVTSPQGKAYFLLENLKTDGDEDSQQWKMFTKSGNKGLAIINRATGNIIHTDAVFDLYYYIQYTHDPEEGDGWNVELISDNQYAVYSTDANGIVKYWYATTPGQPAESFANDYAKNSAYAWTFSWVPAGSTGIKPQPALPDYNIRVYSYDKRIYVEGCDDYRIFTIYGTPVYRNASLPAGIYLVTAKGKTTKVLVQ